MNALKVKPTVVLGHASCGGVAAFANNAVIEYSLENLMTFPAVREAVDKGDLTLHGAYFGIATGLLFIRDPNTKRFTPYSEAGPSASKTAFNAKTGLTG